MVFNSTGTGTNEHPWVVFDPNGSAPTWLVIDNPNANAITLTGTTVGVPIIRSELEDNMIRWAIGAQTGTYGIPFANIKTTVPSSVAMPLTVQVTSAGSADGSLVFSTYNSLSNGTPVSAGWDNDTYRPSDVTHMNDMPTGLVNNSANAIDRFWIIDPDKAPYAYGSKPSVNLTFGFDPVEANINAGNDPGLNASNGNLVAQRFNSALNKWYDIPVLGAQVGNEVNSVVVAPADFFRSWTLSNTLLPLPITLVDWSGECINRGVELRWTTASEQDNDHFTIEKSRHADDWVVLGTIPGANNSSSMISYTFVDEASQGLAYYRLRQTDHNGSSEVSHVIAVGCEGSGGTTIVNAWDDGAQVNLVVSASADGVFDLILHDAQGKVLVDKKAQVVHAGISTLRFNKSDIATGIYLVQLVNADRRMSRRVHIQ